VRRDDFDAFPSWRGRRAVVAGGTGFLGGHLLERLRALGAKVISCSRREGLDLRDRRQAEAFFAQHRPEVVFNLAAHQGGVAYQRLCPGTMLYDNALIVLHTMEAARVAGATRFVNVIAACAYPGDPRDGLLREADFEAGPMHDSADNYGITRRLAVMQAKHYRRQYGFPVTSVVLANCYGPRDHFSSERAHVFAALLRRFFEAKRDSIPEVVVWGRGVAERDLLYVEDAIEGLLRALERAPDADLLNIGTGRACTVGELAETIRAEIGYDGRIVYDASRPEGPLKKTLDVTRMQTLLQWSPPTSLSDGIRRTLAWFAEHYDEAVKGHREINGYRST
jgi:GDP-L-fucose synthase